MICGLDNIVSEANSLSLNTTLWFIKDHLVLKKYISKYIGVNGHVSNLPSNGLEKNICTSSRLLTQMKKTVKQLLNLSKRYKGVPCTIFTTFFISLKLCKKKIQKYTYS